MTLRKLIFENSVKYVYEANSSESEDSTELAKSETVSVPRKQNKTFQKQ